MSVNFILDYNQYNKYKFYDITSIVVFPLGIARAIWNVVKKILHNLSTGIFIPSYKENAKERHFYETKMAELIANKQNDYVFERVKIPCGNLELDGMKIIPRKYLHTKRWIVFSHGNYGTIPKMIEHASLFPLIDKLQAGILLTDFQGVGLSANKTLSRDALLKNTVAAVKYAVEELKPEELIKWGFSFGGAVDTHLNFEIPPPIKFVAVADRTFAGLTAMVQDRTKSLWKTRMARLLNWRLWPIRGAKVAKHPLLVIYHRLDGTIPHRVSLAKRLKKLNLPHVMFYEMRGDEHQWHNFGLTLDQKYHIRAYRPDELDMIDKCINAQFQSISST